MALIDLGRNSGHLPTFAATARAAVVNLGAAIADWNDRRRTRKLLSQLSGHELDDIGLSRADIDAITRAR